MYTGLMIPDLGFGRLGGYLVFMKVASGGEHRLRFVERVFISLSSVYYSQTYGLLCITCNTHISRTRHIFFANSYNTFAYSPRHCSSSYTLMKSKSLF
jgi:hypothetical protein